MPDSPALGVACGLTASAAWALANFYIQRASRLDGPVRPVLAGQVVGAMLLLCALPFSPPGGAPLELRWLALGAVASVVGYVGMFQAFSKGPLSVVSPVLAAWALVSAVLGVVVLHEPVPALRALGGLLVVGGVAGIAARQPDTGAWGGSRTAVIGAALVSAAGFGVMVLATRPIEAALGAPLAVVALWAAQWTVLVPWVAIRHRGRLVPPRNAWGTAAIFGVLEAIGFFAVVLGNSLAPVAVVAPTASLAALLSVGIGWWRLGEPVAPSQVVLAIAVVGGVILLGAA